MLTGERLRFKARKGQWRRRTILHIEEMLRNDWVDTVQALGLAAKLARFGANGERHLNHAIALDFSEAMRHDIRMMLLVIASVGRVWRGVTGLKDAPLYKPTYPEVWEEKLQYPTWNTRTRKQFNKFMEAIGTLQ